MTGLNQTECDEGEAAVLSELHAVQMRVAQQYAQRWKNAGFLKRLWLRPRIRKEMDDEVRKRPWGKDAGPGWFSDSFMNGIAEQKDAPLQSDRARSD